MRARHGQVLREIVISGCLAYATGNIEYGAMLFVVWEFMHAYEINFSGQRMRRYLTRMDLALYKDSAAKKMGATRRTWHFLNLNVAAFNLLAAYFRAELPGYDPEQ